MENILYGTNLDANMVISVADEAALNGVIRVRSELFNDVEQFYRVKGFELDKTIHNGRVTQFDWQKNHVNLQLVKGIQELVISNGAAVFVYEVDGLGTFYSETIVKKNQPVLIEGTLYAIDSMQKTGKKSGTLVVSEFEVSCEVVHTYMVKRYDVATKQVELLGMFDRYVDYLKTKMGVTG